jgi:hypothetical protein
MQVLVGQFSPWLGLIEDVSLPEDETKLVPTDGHTCPRFSVRGCFLVIH